MPCRATAGGGHSGRARSGRGRGSSRRRSRTRPRTRTTPARAPPPRSAGCARPSARIGPSSSAPSTTPGRTPSSRSSRQRPKAPIMTQQLMLHPAQATRGCRGRRRCCRRWPATKAGRRRRRSRGREPIRRTVTARAVGGACSAGPQVGRLQPSRVSPARSKLRPWCNHRDGRLGLKGYHGLACAWVVLAAMCIASKLLIRQCSTS